MALFRWLQSAWQWMRSLFHQVGTEIQQGVQSGFRRLQRSGRSLIASIPNAFPILDQLAPRQQILLTYLGMVDWLKENGVARKANSTPFEFSLTLTRLMPQAEPEIHSLTKLFVEARYTRHPISPQQSALVRSQWQHLQRAFKEQQEQQESEAQP